MHNAALQALGLNAVYVALDCPPDHLQDALSGLHALGAVGVNLTVPLKEVAAGLLATLDESALRAGAVNTVVFTPDGPVGHSTDAYGFTMAHKEAFGCNVSASRVLFLGAGGAARSAAVACAEQGAADVLLCARTESRAQDLAEVMREQVPTCTCRVIPWNQRAQVSTSVNLVVNATPMGLRPDDDSPLPSHAFHAGQRVLDMVYARQRNTPLVAAAQEGGAQAVDGLGMLLHQGVRSLEIWTGQQAPVDVMRQALEEMS